MKCFTVANGVVSRGVAVQKFALSGAGVEIDAILVGETGRGRELGILPVASSAIERQEGGDRVMFASVGRTRSDRPKLVPQAGADSGEFCLVVFRTGMGFRGGNSHTGDRNGWKCFAYGCNANGDGDAPAKCPANPDDHWGNMTGCPKPVFSDFPGEVLCRGTIAEGAAGRMGSGEQLVAVMPKGVTFRTGYSGRLYGGPSAHYYVFDGERIISATWDERMAADLF